MPEHPASKRSALVPAGPSFQIHRTLPAPRPPTLPPRKSGPVRPPTPTSAATDAPVASPSGSSRPRVAATPALSPEPAQQPSSGFRQSLRLSRLFLALPFLERQRAHPFSLLLVRPVNFLFHRSHARRRRPRNFLQRHPLHL